MENYIKNNIRQRYQNKLEDSKIALEKWNEIKYLYKKDGTPFANLKKAFENASYGFDYIDDRKERPRLRVSFQSSHGWQDDCINCYEYNKTDKRFLSMDEIISCVEERKFYLQALIEEMEEKLNKLDEIFTDLDKALDGVREVIDKYNIEIHYEYDKYVDRYLKHKM